MALLAVAGVRALGLERGTLSTLLVGASPLVLAAGYPLLVASLLLRRRVLAPLAALVVAAHVAVVVPALGADDLPAATDGAPRLRVVTANLYVLNPVPEQAGAALRALRPDVLVVPELDADGLAGLRAAGLLEELPHSVVRDDAREETVGLFSRLPLSDVDVRRAGGRALPRATVRVGDVDVRVASAHPLPPISVLGPVWRDSLGDLVEEVRAVELPLVVAGDLNGDRDHRAFRALLDAGLRDAHDSRGRGLARTWPASLPVLHLDHVLVRGGRGGDLVTTRVREVRLPGSDHLAVVADVAVLGGSAQ